MKKPPRTRRATQSKPGFELAPHTPFWKIRDGDNTDGPWYRCPNLEQTHFGSLKKFGDVYECNICEFKGVRVGNSIIKRERNGNEKHAGKME